MNAKQIAARYSASVLIIKAYDKFGCVTQGSGVVLKSRNLLITNYHIIQGSSYFELEKSGKTVEYDFVIAIDKEKDLVLIKLRNSNKYPKLKTSAKLSTGDKIFAIGNPQGFEGSISSGEINGVGRVIESYDHPWGIRFENLIQISASISDGSSGGAVINEKGELIGISTMIYNAGQNLNFAIPIDTALKLFRRSSMKLYHRNKKLTEEVLRFHLCFISNNLEQAVIHIDKCLEYNKYNEYFLYSKIMLLTSLNRYDESILLCDQLLNINPKNKDVLHIKLTALSKALRFKEALVVSNELTGIEEEYYILCIKGSIYIQMYELGKSYECFLKAANLNKVNPVALLGMAEYYSLSGQYYKAGRIAYSLLVENPELIMPIYTLGSIYFHAFKIEKALSFFNEFFNKVDNQLKSHDETKELTSDIYNYSLLVENARTLKIGCLIFLRQIEEAEEETNSLIYSYPGNPFYHMNKAHIEAALGNFNDAIISINKSLEINPSNSGAYFLQGLILFSLENYKGALKSFNRSLKITPNLIGALKQKASTLILMNDYSKAIGISKKISKIYPNASESIQIMSELFDAKRDKDMLLESTKKLIKSKPNDNEYLAIHANALVLNNKPNEALIYINKSLKIKESLIAFVIKSNVLFELKKYREVIDIFKTTKNKYPYIQPVLDGQLRLVKAKSEIKIKMYTSAKQDLENAILECPHIEKESLKLLKKIQFK